MDAVAAAAGVGKGTVFRRFDSREGLMAAVLNHSETEWQALGDVRSAAARPGRRAVGAAARLRPVPARDHDAARRADPRGRPRRRPRRTRAYSFVAMHVRYLLVPARRHRRPPAARGRAARAAGGCRSSTQVALDGFPVDRVYDGWVDLARRIVGQGRLAASAGVLLGVARGRGGDHLDASARSRDCAPSGRARAYMDTWCTLPSVA